MKLLEFRNEKGKLVSGNEVVFPLFTQGGQTGYRLIGTGFLILKKGVFVTAKHCLTDNSGNKLPWLMGLMAHGHMRRVDIVILHEEVDVAVGIFEKGDYDCKECTNHRIISLTNRTPDENEELFHFGCNQTRFDLFKKIDDEWLELQGRISLRGYKGRYEGFCPGDPTAPWPHHFTNSYFPSGSSGGPTVSACGFVCGINSRSSKGFEEVPPHGRLTRVSDLLTGQLTGNIIVSGRELVKPSFYDIVIQGGGRVEGFEK
ncbi:MAG: serine protease [Calditrichaeota bacterium]|nr:MAG: serine protease [Calditrichota bacterium]